MKIEESKLELWAKRIMGIIGLIGFVWIIVALITSLIKDELQTQSLISGLVVYISGYYANKSAF